MTEKLSFTVELAIVPRVKPPHENRFDEPLEMDTLHQFAGVQGFYTTKQVALLIDACRTIYNVREEEKEAHYGELYDGAFATIRRIIGESGGDA